MGTLEIGTQKCNDPIRVAQRQKEPPDFYSLLLNF